VLRNKPSYRRLHAIVIRIAQPQASPVIMRYPHMLLANPPLQCPDPRAGLEGKANSLTTGEPSLDRCYA
jgi:hypothetical protein